MYTLQVAPSGVPFAIVALIIIIIISVALTRWLFRIDEQIRNQQAMIWLLIKLSQKGGVEKEELEKIIKAFKIK